MATDVLSELLRSVRLTGAAYFDVAARDPWVAEQLPAEIFLPKILPGSDHLIAYHVVTEGRCYATLLGGEPITLEAGEVVVFTNGDPHAMSSSPGMRVQSFNEDVIDSIHADQLPFVIRYGGEGPPTARLVCGFLACHARPFNPLLESLPPVIKAGTKDDADWLGQFIRVATMETANKRAGGESVLGKLSELMFIEVVRRHLESLPPDQAGWLAGLRDPFVGKALSLMHAAPAHPWTIEKLAKEAGASRSVLAERFAQLVGITPLQYLIRWRMQIALGLLGGNASVASIAVEAGYESEAAFSRAFKKAMGVSPSAWRRRSDGAQPGIKPSA
jgi:AraC-like DNA-binding protein